MTKRCSARAIAAIAAISVAAAATVRADGTAIAFRGFEPLRSIPVRQRAHSVVADDLNGDGHADLIVAVAGADSVAVLLGKGDGSFGAPTYWRVGKAPKFAVTGDFNHDGRRDIVSADQDSDSISVLMGNGDGTFKPKVSHPACHGAHEVAVADFNRDGNDDIVVTCWGVPSFASVFLGKGDGTFAPRIDVHPGTSPAALTVGDFNENGIPDIAFSTTGDNAVGVLIGKGDGTFQEARHFATAVSPGGIRAADLNGDGHLDLVTANDVSNTVSILYGRGDGTFGGRVDLTAASSPKSIEIADVNGDGRADIIVTNTSYPICCTVDGSTISIYLNTGNGHFAPRRDYFAGGNPFGLLVRDLNGDGRIDIATANFINRTGEQRTYLTILQALGITSRTLKIWWFAISLGAGAAVWFAMRRGPALRALGMGLLAFALFYAPVWDASRARSEGGSDVSILFGH